MLSERLQELGHIQVAIHENFKKPDFIGVGDAEVQDSDEKGAWGLVWITADQHVEVTRQQQGTCLYALLGRLLTDLPAHPCDDVEALGDLGKLWQL